SMVNPVPEVLAQGYTTTLTSFDGSLRETFPTTLDASDGIKSLISTIGLGYCWSGGGGECLDTAAVLTVLNTAPAPGTFRPSYANSSKTLYNIAQIQWDKLPSLPVPPGVNLPEDLALGDFNDQRFMVRPWIDHGPKGSGSKIHPINNMRPYAPAGTIYPPELADMSMLVLMDIPERDELLIRFLQLGIDIYPIALQNDNEGWRAHGGGNNGRKWPILFAGIMLDNTGMQNPPETVNFAGRLGPVRRFAEDGFTFYGTATVNYTSGKPLWGADCPSENVCEGGSKDCRDTNGTIDGCAYIGGTAPGWPGQALAAHLMNATEIWNWPPFFDYVDRWTYEGNPSPSLTSPRWTWGSEFIQGVWPVYRGPAYPDGTCDPGEDSVNHPIDCA
ncbi:MAG: hypothetical protein JSW41_04225, partial [Candidatus Aenigmatarchaeota archaeon]